MKQESTNTGFVILISLVATIGGFLFGFDSGVINGTVDGLKKAFNSDSVATGFNVASMLLGCGVGAFFAGTLADKIGRRAILIISAVLFIVSAWGSGIATGSAEFIIYRVLGGLAVGAASVIAPAYISEIAPARYRGTLTSIQQIAIISGLFFAFLSNYLIAGSAGGSTQLFAWGYEAWRWMFWVELAPAFLFLFALFVIPESPRFLVASGKNDQALGVLKRLMGDGGQEKLREIQASLAGDHHRPRLRDILDPKLGIRPIVWVGVWLAAFQQLVGINVVFYYGTAMLEKAGFAQDSALSGMAVIGFFNMIFTMVAVAFVDKFGRRPLLQIGTLGAIACLSALAFFFGGGGNILIVLMCAFVACFAFSLGPVKFIFASEIFPTNIRSHAMSIAILAMWAADTIVAQFTPALRDAVGPSWTFFIFALIITPQLLMVWKFMPETAGRSLEEIEQEYSR